MKVSAPPQIHRCVGMCSWSYICTTWLRPQIWWPESDWENWPKPGEADSLPEIGGKRFYFILSCLSRKQKIETWVLQGGHFPPAMCILKSQSEERVEADVEKKICLGYTWLFMGRVLQLCVLWNILISKYSLLFWLKLSKAGFRYRQPKKILRSTVAYFKF